MVRWAVLLMKLIIGGGVIWKTTDYVVTHYPNDYPGLPVEIEIWCSLIVITGSACLFLMALALINKENVLRVLANWSIIAVFTFAAWGFGNLMARAPEERMEQTKSWYYCLVCAMIGAPMGYVVCLTRGPTAELEQDESMDDANEFESGRLADMAHE